MSLRSGWIVAAVTALVVVGSTAAIAVPAGGLVHGIGDVESAGEPSSLGSSLQVSDTGYRPNETGPTDGPNVSVDWAAEPGGQTTGPTAANGQVYVGTGNGNNALYAYNATTGDIVWEFTLNNRPGSDFQTEPVVADGRVYVLSYSFGPTALFAVDITDGTQVWQQSVSDGTTRPVASNGRVYYETGGQVFARDGATGQEVWNRSFGGGTNRPAIAGGQVYVPTGGSTDNLTALSATNGSILWGRAGTVNDVAATDTDVYAARNGDVVAFAPDGTVQWNYTSDANSYVDVRTDGSQVYAATTGDTGITALGAAGGVRAWRLATDAGVSGTPVVTDRALYVGTQDGRVRAVDSGTGDVLWTRVSDDAVGGPDVADGRLFVGGSSSLRAYTDTGARLPDPTETADNDGYDPTAVGPTDGPNVSVDWEVTPGGETRGAVVANGRAFVGTHGNGNSLYAYDLTTGTQEWRFSLNNRNGGSFMYRAAVHDGTVYAIASDGFGDGVAVYAVSAADGTIQWETSVSDSVRRPIATDGGVFLASNGRVRSLDPVTGSEEWRFELDGGVRTQPVIDDGRLYIGTNRGFNPGFTYAINARTGGGLWKTNDGNVRGLAARDGTVYVAKDNEVTARDAADGTLRWRHDSSASTFLSAAVDDDTVYVGTTGSSGLSALNRSAGTIRWREELDTPADRPVVTGTGVYLGASSGRVYALTQSGDRRWTRVSDAAVSGPAVAADRVVVGGSGTVRTYTDTGARLPDPTETADNDGYDPTAVGPTDGPNVAVDWETVPGGETRGAVVANGRAFVGTHGNGNSLYAYDLTTGAQQWSFSLNNRNGGSFMYRAAVHDGTVYAIASDGFGDGIAIYAVSAADGTIQWQTSVSDSVRRPIITDGGVFLASNGRVRSLDPVTGSEEWRFELDGGVRTQPVIDDGRLYIGTNRGFDPGFTYAINARTGGGLWKTNDGNVRGLAVRDGSVYVAKDNEVTARDAATGSLQWRHDSSAGTFLSAAVDDDTVYVGTTGSSGLSALNRSTGTIRWREATDQPSDRPVVTSTGVYLGASSGRVYAFSQSGDRRWTRVYDAAVSGPAVTADRVVVGGSGTVRTYTDTGARLPDPTESAGADADGYDPTSVGPTDNGTLTEAWNRTVGSVDTTAPETAAGRVFVGTSNGDNTLYAYNLTTGTQQWSFSLNNRNGGNFKYRPTVRNGTVYAVASDGFGNGVAVYAVSAADGTFQWQTSVDDSVRRPVVTDGGVFLASNSRARSLDPATGTPEWQFELSGGVRTQPVVDDGRLYIGTNRGFDPGFTYAINARTGGGLWKVNDGNVRGLAVRDGSVYVAKDNEVTARDAADGARQWRHDGSADTFLQVATDGDRVYTTTQGTTGVTTLDAANGDPLAREPTGAGVSGRVILARGGAFFGTGDGSVVAINRSTGDQLWTRTVGASASEVAVTGTRLVVSNGSGRVVAYNGTGSGPELPPEVTLTASDTTVGVNQTVTFEATASDPDGDVTAIAWDLDGDGIVEATGPTASTQYAATGQYPVSVTVTDDTGLTATASTTVSVEALNATPPSVTASVASATVQVNETVTFQATATDPDGNVNTITWDFDGDGVVDANGSTATTSFQSAGQYDVNVTATDDSGLTATDTVSVTVEAPNATPPTVTASVANATVGVNETVTFQATASDPDGTVQTITWDFDGDGVGDANGSTATTSFQSAGQYDVNVTVTDDAGLTATDTVSVTVQTGNPFGSDGLPGGSSDQPPTDVDGDGQYEDLNGDDRFTFVDVIEFVFALQSVDYATLPQAQIDAVDFDGDGSVNFVDVIELVFEL